MIEFRLSPDKQEIMLVRKQPHMGRDYQYLATVHVPPEEEQEMEAEFGLDCPNCGDSAEVIRPATVRARFDLPRLKDALNHALAEAGL